ncbi:MAG: glutamate-1-semialdehyde 2,1-aminomutase [Phycisphaerales bacterium]|nr:glutamate-1-semialdehyde 2,1-aminomutase [Phycisphaerales bacterium]
MAEMRDRLLRVIPGGAHTYSRGFDVYPSNAPDVMVRGKGCRAWSADDREFVDLAMALASVGIGYAEEAIDEAAIAQIRNGNTASRPSLVELQAAERFVDLVGPVDMVKFTKNGSTAVTAAIKLARAHTGRIKVARCRQHPFFSYDDWFIGSTALKKGIPDAVIENTLMFDFNDLDSLAALVESNPDEIACVVMEPMTVLSPAGLPTADSGPFPLVCRGDIGPGKRTFLHDVQAFCQAHGIVFVLDEMLTGFRWDLGGAQGMLGLEPDISTFGKAMANGFSVACVAGKREVMEHGSIEFSGRERVFLLSTTHGAEMCGLGAFLETVDFSIEHDVTGALWSIGERLVKLVRSKAAAHGLDQHVLAGGQACRPGIMVLDREGRPCDQLRSLMMQEMIAHGVLFGALNPCYRLDEEAFEVISTALDHALPVIDQGLANGVDGLLQGEPVKPVFRQYN